MEFGLPKCGVLIMKRGKVANSEGTSIPHEKMMKNIEEDEYKYLAILEADGAKHEEMKGQISKEYIRRVRNMLRLKLKWREYYFGHQSKSSFRCKIWGRNHKLDKNET